MASKLEVIAERVGDPKEEKCDRRAAVADVSAVSIVFAKLLRDCI